MFAHLGLGLFWGINGKTKRKLHQINYYSDTRKNNY